MKKFSQIYYILIFVSCLMLIQMPHVFAQQSPRISSLFPAGGKVGTVAEISIQGANLNDAHTMIIRGAPGITAELFPVGGEVDTTHQQLFEGTCVGCHELRSPGNRSMTPAQWEATVDRMINDRNAAITPEERDKVVSYLQSAARANGGLTARLTSVKSVLSRSRALQPLGPLK